MGVTLLSEMVFLSSEIVSLLRIISTLLTGIVSLFMENMGMSCLFGLKGITCIKTDGIFL